jgi:SAM-dependent methyltransferase
MITSRRAFLEQYRIIRSAEGRGSEDSAYYQALPFHDSWQWRIRARTYSYFERTILPAEPCRLLDLGAGNGWLSNRVASQGHSVIALDIFRDERDGLGAVHHYGGAFPAVEADFHQLPFPSASFDLIVFNASLHYSPDYAAALNETRRCLAPGGRVVVLDSPVYRLPEHGLRMREERQQQFQQQYGFRSEALGSIEFLDEPLIAELARELGMRWEIHKPWYGWQWHLRPLRATLKGQRPPSRFWILVGSFRP